MAYMGTAGMLPQLWDAGNGMLREGESVGDQLPALNYAQSYLKAIAGLGDGDISDQDVRNLQVAAPLGTVAPANIAVGVLRDML